MNRTVFVGDRIYGGLFRAIFAALLHQHSRNSGGEGLACLDVNKMYTRDQWRCLISKIIRIMLTTMNVELTAEQKNALEALQRKSRDPHIRDRVRCVLLSSEYRTELLSSHTC